MFHAFSINILRICFMLKLNSIQFETAIFITSRVTSNVILLLANTEFNNVHTH